MSHPAIKHIFVLVLENRSFDHLLGFSEITGTDPASGQPTKINGLTGTESNPYGGQRYPVCKGADTALTVDPNHEFENIYEQLIGPGASPPLPAGGNYPATTGTGFVSSYVKSGSTATPATPGDIMKCCDPSQVPVLTALAREFAVCDSWFSSLPGPTWPNRFFVVAGSSGGLDHSPTTQEMVEWGAVEGFRFQKGTIFQQKGLSWRIYAGGALAIVQGLQGIEFPDVHPLFELAPDLNSKIKPYTAQFTFIEPDYGDVATTYKGGNSQHPLDGVSGGERLIKQVYETLRASPLWESSLLIVTWDEHGGFYDHVRPPETAPRPGDTIQTKGASQWGFSFTQYGVRVPAVVVSPLIPRNLIDHHPYDHSSILATVEAQFGLPPLTERDKQARSVLALASLSQPRSTPARLPDAPASAPARPGPAPDPLGPVNQGNLPGFLHAALRALLHLAPPPERPALIARFKALQTRADGGRFLADAVQRILAAGLPPRPGAGGP